MLDLTIREQRFFEVILPNELHLNIPMPSVAEYDSILSELQGFENIVYGDDILNIALKILRKNKEGVVLEKEDLEEMLNLNDLMAIILGYTSEVTKVFADPNSKSPVVGKAKRKTGISNEPIKAN